MKHIAEFAWRHAHVPYEDGCEVAVRKPNRLRHFTYGHSAIMQQGARVAQSLLLDISVRRLIG